MSAPGPPRFVPTLTEIVQPAPTPGAEPVAQATPLGDLPAGLESRIVQRVLQRLDLSLERRLREVVGQLILEQTQSLLPRLREEIENVVSQSVSQAMELESLNSQIEQKKNT
ncbi:hypothetical protein [Polaromonas sp.]|uniref:hypothetical protein n=1 Tax=Polaromonas sp. TaxID=1869339 RepID=UPI00286A64BC|nr:hypothetical protein [Polaromonas sp.]